VSRETVMAALFTKLSAISAFKTTGRRVQYWAEVAAQPALFLHHIADEYHRGGTGMPGKVTMECQVWIYDNTGVAAEAVPETAVHALIELVETALDIPPGFRAQTLGGLVTHCWIEGRTDIHPGDIGPQAIAVMTVKILVPAFRG